MGILNDFDVARAQKGQLLGVRIKGTSAVDHVEGLPFVLPSRNQGGMEKFVVQREET